MILQFISSELHICDGKHSHMPRVTCIKRLPWPSLRQRQEP